MLLDEKVADVLHQASQVLDERGWIQGHLEDAQGVCSLGALYAVTEFMVDLDVNMIQQRAIGCMHQAIEASGMRRGVASIANWNDQPERTVEDVKLMLKQAAALAVVDSLVSL